MGIDEAFSEAMEDMDIVDEDLAPTLEINTPLQSEKEEDLKEEKLEGEKEKESKEPLREEEKEPKIKPHGSLSDEEKQLFTELPRSMQEFVNRRAQEAAKGVTQSQQELAKIRKEYDAVKNAVEPFRGSLQEGMTEAEIVKLALADYSALANPQTRMAKLYQIALGNGVTPSELIEYLQRQPQVDPVHLRSHQQIEALAMQNQSLRAEQAKQTQGAINQLIDSVKTETTADGTPLRVHFEAVEDDVANIIAKEIEADSSILSNPFLLRQKIANAYDRVIADPDRYNSAWADPSLREKLLEKKRQSLLEAENLKEQRAKTARAKSRSTVVGGIGTLANSSVQRGGLDGAIEAAFAQLEA